MTAALATTQPTSVGVAYPREQIELLKRTIAKGATDDELALGLEVAQRTGLNPFARQIFFVTRWDSKERREVMTIQTSVDGLRLIAERTGKYEGQTPEEWCGPDGKWREVWLDSVPPAAARIGVLKAGNREPIYAVATYAEYCQTKKDGSAVHMWAKMPARMLLKCAESLALRKAFPQECSGLYTTEEYEAAPVEDPAVLLNRDIIAMAPDDRDRLIKLARTAGLDATSSKTLAASLLVLAESATGVDPGDLAAVAAHLEAVVNEAADTGTAADAAEVVEDAEVVPDGTEEPVQRASDHDLSIPFGSDS